MIVLLSLFLILSITGCSEKPTVVEEVTNGNIEEINKVNNEASKDTEEVSEEIAIEEEVIEEITEEKAIEILMQV